MLQEKVDHIVNRFLYWKHETDHSQITINEDLVPFAYTFGTNVCGDYIRMTRGESYIITSVENLQLYLQKYLK